MTFYPDIDDNGHQLRADAAVAFRDLEAAATRAGFRLIVNSAYRSPEKQKSLYIKYIKDCAAWERAGAEVGKKPSPVALPGTSEHEWGIAVDLNTQAPGLLKWLVVEATLHGFYMTARGEHWHYAYYPKLPPAKLLARHRENLANILKEV